MIRHATVFKPMRFISNSILFLAIAFAFLLNCAPRANAQESSRTVYYLHGRIYTNDPANPWAEAMSIRDGKIRCIGKISYVLLDCGGNEEGVETIQLKGRFVMPGFNDAHVHLGAAAAGMVSVQLRGVDSIEELQKRLAEAVANHKAGEWITGSGWDHTLWAEKKFPNRKQLDEVSPKNPVILTHISGHVAVANSLALEHAEIDKTTPNPPGGQIELPCLAAKAGELPAGLLFLPYGDQSSKLMAGDTHGTGMPTSKGIDVEVEKV